MSGRVTTHTTTGCRELPLLTHSRIQAFKTCPRKHHYAYNLGVRRRPSEALRLGGAVHLGLDMLKKNYTVAQALDAINASYKDLLENTLLPADQIEVERAKALALVAGWAWRWGDTPIRYLASEVPFEIPLINPDTRRPSRRFSLAGKIDGIAELEDGRLALVEHKTCGESIAPDSTYWKRVRIDHQISLYMIAARRIGYDVRTCLYDVMRKPAIKPRKLTAKKQKMLGRERENYEDYAKRLMVEIQTDPTSYYARHEVPRFDADLFEVENELWDVSQQIAEAERHGRHYRNSGACVAPYPCEYLDICASGTDLTEELPSGFERTCTLHPELEQSK